MANSEKKSSLPLFGGTIPWKSSEWTQSDDSIRGGSSESHLTIKANTAIFHGTLDYTTLGGAGFASQRTATASQTWDLSAYSAIHLDLTGCQSWGHFFGLTCRDRRCGKYAYTFIIKDSILPPDPSNGREQSTVSWEMNFDDCSSGVKLPLGEFKPFYRGKAAPNSAPLRKDSVRRFSVMIRSNFGEQQGPFSLGIKSIGAQS